MFKIKLCKRELNIQCFGCDCKKKLVKSPENVGLEGVRLESPKWISAVSLKSVLDLNY